MKNAAEVVARFTDLIDHPFPRHPVETSTYIAGSRIFPEERTITTGGGLVLEDVSLWITKAAVAIEDVFPPSHGVVREWARFREAYANTSTLARSATLDQGRGVLRAARDAVEHGQLTTLETAARCETERDLLEQAEDLLGAGYKPAAAVLAGGALETHLRGLCDRHELKVQPPGSIEKYSAAVAQARKVGPSDIYSKTDGKHVTAWGGMRNDAAHTPGEFAQSTDDVRRMIEGIRDFIERIR